MSVFILHMEGSDEGRTRSIQLLIFSYLSFRRFRLASFILLLYKFSISNLTLIYFFHLFPSTMLFLTFLQCNISLDCFNCETKLELQELELTSLDWILGNILLFFWSGFLLPIIC